MDFRGGPPPDWMQGLGQSPAAAPAAAAVPSLLQMAQGDPQAVSDLRGSGGFQPEQVPTAGAAPAYDPRTAFGGYNAVFDERAPNTGGWFTMADYLKQAPTPMEAATGPGRMGPHAPDIAARTVGGGNNFLSTNNWRLLPENFRTPDYFQINGTIVDRRLAREQLRPKTPMEQGGESAGHPGYRHLGQGAWKTPMGFNGGDASMAGYIGGLTPWGITSGYTT